MEAEPLSELAPVVVWRLIDAIEKHGLNNDSLYRAPPATGGPAELRQALDSDPLSVDLDQYDVVSLTDALRGFLQELPVPIIPAVVYSELVYTAQESQSVEECGERLKRILECPSIPRANQQLLVHLSRHLARVSQHHQSGPRLLGQALSDSVFKHSPLSADVNPEHHVRILEALIATGGLMEIQTAPAFVSALVCNG
ncbi:hypothetical protein CesoFtcFv8_004673 [Champsocephalus esox]|uniref:Rho-GAP domain-containing protein n=1 Tax=Champsocephalus esox TaxID=159716 RepID=A0AAN8CMX6_9TELE|nr:hypothetical protein CesoFtcFv8_004673 [Champsocephalus esox]